MCLLFCADARIEVLTQQVEDASKLQQKYTSDLGQITVDADREANGLRRDKRFLQDEVNKLEGRLNSLITGSQEQTNEINRLKLVNRDLALEKMEHEIEIDRLRMQLRMRPEMSSTMARGVSGNFGVGDGGGSNEGGADLKSNTGGGDGGKAVEAKHGISATAPERRGRHETEISDKFPSIFQKMTEHQVIE